LIIAFSPGVGNPQGNGEGVLVAGDGVPHQHQVLRYVEDEYEAMAASKGPEAVAVAALQGEAAGRDSVRGLESRYKGVAVVSVEEPEEGRAAAVAAVVAAEAVEEAGVGGEAAPALADECRAGEGGGLRWEAEEDLAEEVVVFQRSLHRRRAGAAAEEAAHLALVTHRCGICFFSLWKVMRGCG
jgi:hypothetical protein